VTALRNAALAAALAALFAARAAAQDPRLERLDPVTRIAVAALVDSARQSGLPAEALIDRALEGSAKQASAPRIIAAVTTLLADLRGARAALGAAATAPELEAGASAMHLGVPPTALTRLRMIRSRQPLTIALSVMADLTARGVPADSAAAAVLALAASLRDDQFLAFRRSVERDIELGAPPAAAASSSVRLGAGGLPTTSSGGPSTSIPPRRP
jgi:hypothetical protein